MATVRHVTSSSGLFRLLDLCRTEGTCMWAWMHIYICVCEVQHFIAQFGNMVRQHSLMF